MDDAQALVQQHESCADERVLHRPREDEVCDLFPARLADRVVRPIRELVEGRHRRRVAKDL